MIDINKEEVLSLVEAAKTLPSRNGRRIHPSTIWRWSREGVGGIRLEYARLGRAIVTSREALARFATALAEADTELHPKAAPITRTRSERRRQAAIDQADKRLTAAGV